LGEDVVDALVLRKWTTVPRWLQPDNGETDRKNAEEQHGQQQGQVKVVGSRRPEENLVRHVAGQNCPGAQVKNYYQLYDIQGRKTRREEHSHPKNRN